MRDKFFSGLAADNPALMGETLCVTMATHEDEDDGSFMGRPRFKPGVVQLAVDSSMMVPDVGCPSCQIGETEEDDSASIIAEKQQIENLPFRHQGEIATDSSIVFGENACGKIKPYEDEESDGAGAFTGKLMADSYMVMPDIGCHSCQMTKEPTEHELTSAVPRNIQTKQQYNMHGKTYRSPNHGSSSSIQSAHQQPKYPAKLEMKLNRSSTQSLTSSQLEEEAVELHLEEEAVDKITSTLSRKMKKMKKRCPQKIITHQSSVTSQLSGQASSASLEKRMLKSGRNKVCVKVEITDNTMSWEDKTAKHNPIVELKQDEDYGRFANDNEELPWYLEAFSCGGGGMVSGGMVSDTSTISSSYTTCSETSASTYSSRSYSTGSSVSDEASWVEFDKQFEDGPPLHRLASF